MNTSPMHTAFNKLFSESHTRMDFFNAIKSGRGALISSVLPEDIFTDRKFVAVLDEESGEYRMEVEQVTVMIEHADVRQYLHTLETISAWLAIEFPEVSMTAKQHGYDIEFTLTPNLYK